jgi:cathepsin B
LILALIGGIFCSELLVTKEYVEQLKRTVSWVVEDYENNIFRDWTVEEAKSLLGLKSLEIDEYMPEVDTSVPTPSEISWQGANCDHGPQNQGHCGSCWAFAATGMLSDRCCLGGHDHGWLSPQELVSCDKGDSGCNGGYLDKPLNYITSAGGLVPDACFPYKAQNLPCPTKCADGKDWKSSHVCKCQGIQRCSGTDGIKACLKDGPVTIGFMVCQSFMNYKGGIYKCDCTNYLGGHAVLVMGHSDTPECHYHVKNSWGTSWGVGGYFDIACTTCRLQGGAVCSKVVG